MCIEQSARNLLYSSLVGDAAVVDQLYASETGFYKRRRIVTKANKL